MNADMLDSPGTREISEWRAIPGWTNYEVSEFGQVRRAIAIRISPKHSLLKSFLRNGYPTVSLCFGGGTGKARKFLIHRLVAAAFLDPPPTVEYEVAHNDGNRQNLHYSNLRWATRVENEADKKIHGTLPYKLTPEIVAKVRASTLSNAELGRQFNIDPSYLSKVRRGLFWTQTV